MCGGKGFLGSLFSGGGLGGILGGLAGGALDLFGVPEAGIPLALATGGGSALGSTIGGVASGEPFGKAITSGLESGAITGGLTGLGELRQRGIFWGRRAPRRVGRSAVWSAEPGLSARAAMCRPQRRRRRPQALVGTIAPAGRNGWGGAAAGGASGGLPSGGSRPRRAARPARFREPSARTSPEGRPAPEHWHRALAAPARSATRQGGRTYSHL